MATKASRDRLKGAHVLLGITGSIAAYKACEIIRRAKEVGAEVRVIVTEAGEKFVGETTLATLSGSPVIKEMFAFSEKWSIEHIAVAEWAHVLLIAPATADILGKVAAGIADDILSTTALTVTCPIVFAPAMNVHMWENRVVHNNVERLREFGYHIVEPEAGFLACGYEGKGRLADVETILIRVREVLASTRRSR